MRKSPQNGQTWRNGARRGSDWLGREAFPHPWLVSGDLSQLYSPSFFHPFWGVGSSCLATLPPSGFSWPPSLGEQWWPTGIGHRLPIYRLPGRNTNNQYTNPDAGTHRKTISKLSATNSVSEEDSSKSIGHKIQSFHKSQQLSIAAQYRTPISERFGRRNGAQGHLGDGQSYCDSYEANDSYQAIRGDEMKQ